MVTDHILIRDKWGKLKKITKVLIVIFVIALIALIIFFSGFLTNNKPSNQNRIVLENPLKDIVFANTNEQGQVNRQNVVDQAILEFDVDYINFILVVLGVNNLDKSKIGFGNPKVELRLDDEIWSTEVIKGSLRTQKSEIENEDIIIHMSKNEVVESLLNRDIKTYIIDSVKSGRTTIEMVAGKPELFSKGYLSMYKDLTGEEPEI